MQDHSVYIGLLWHSTLKVALQGFPHFRKQPSMAPEIELPEEAPLDSLISSMPDQEFLPYASEAKAWHELLQSLQSQQVGSSKSSKSSARRKGQGFLVF